MLKQFLKAGLIKVIKKIPYQSKMNLSDARETLQKWSPLPQGTCFTNNQSVLAYDLQIIVPAYNVEHYIEDCVLSVCRQNTQYQVLLTVVDDGSTDGTSVCLHKLQVQQKASKNITLEVLTQQNRGASSARNAGLKEIKENYVAFLDADDVLPENAIEHMMTEAHRTGADILQGSWYSFSDTKSRKECISEDLSGYPWGKLYKYTVLKNFCFPLGYWFEDTPISFILAALPFTHVTTSEVIYGYRQNEEGLTAKATKGKKPVDSYWITETCLQEFPLFGVPYDQCAYQYLLQQSIMTARRIRKQPWRIREAVFVLTRGLMQQYFNEYSTEDSRLSELESALKNNEFLKFEWLVKGF